MKWKALTQASTGLTLALLTGCTTLIAAPTPLSPTAALLLSTATSIQPTSTSIPPTLTPTPLPDLTQRPLIWFGPLDPSPPDASRPFSGRPDFFHLFPEGAPWTMAEQKVDVFRLYGGWVAWHASEAELRQVVEGLNRRGIAIAFEAGALTPTEACTGEIEGFAGRQEGIRIAQGIKEAGGTVRFVELDHAFDAGTSADASACRRTPEEIAQDVAAYVQSIRRIFPNVVVGDTITAQLDVNKVALWVDAYRAVTGEDLGFLHLDVPWGEPNWPEKVREIEDYLRSRGIEYGVFYLGDWNAFNDEEWLSQAGERVKAYELIAGGRPDHIIFTTWHDHPDRLLPEDAPYTFTWFIDAYFEDKSALGYRTEGPGANVAFRKSARASKAAQSAPEGAVDGNLETFWGAGDFAPQWIEVDLGAPYGIAEIRMLTEGSNGETVHRVLGKGPGTGGAYVLLHTFSGFTTTLQWLTYTPPTPWSAVQFVRVETVGSLSGESPSWISWREIEVISGE